MFFEQILHTQTWAITVKCYSRPESVARFARFWAGVSQRTWRAGDKLLTCDGKNKHQHAITSRMLSISLAFFLSFLLPLLGFYVWLAFSLVFVLQLDFRLIFRVFLVLRLFIVRLKHKKQLDMFEHTNLLGSARGNTAAHLQACLHCNQSITWKAWFRQNRMTHDDEFEPRICPQTRAHHVVYSIR